MKQERNQNCQKRILKSLCKIAFEKSGEIIIIKINKRVAFTA